MIIFLSLVLIVGLWFAVMPIHAMTTVNRLAIWVLNKFCQNKVAIRKSLQETHRLLNQEPEKLKSNFQMIRTSGIAILVVDSIWVWILYFS